ncbi:hypothetical protein DY000_02046185 [Brassica cretica]|uniref:Uncharacterized protein n=1 Tax=Brassica cretica TaxID=69181 RepID=A0ABQ7EYE0_BRACR|nr:hypothetical protein DY000_02046185 [Brassica cretica]
MGATSRSDAMRSLQTTSQSDLAGATPRSRSPSHPSGSRKLTRSDLSERPLQRGSEVPQRRQEVVPAGSDVIRATGPSRSHFQCPELENRSRSDVSQRPHEGSRIALGATSCSDHVRSLAFSVDQSDVTQRPREVARVFCDPERPIIATTPGRSRAGTMVKKTKGKSDAERQEPERQESSLRGKALASERAGSGTQRTSRQQTVAAKKAKEQEKRAGKSIAVATDEESGDESADEQAPTKRAKMSKGKEVADDRDRAKTPSEEELYHHLLNGVTWTPTRFADLDLLKEFET